MAWKGFLIESKLYMNYPGLWKGYWAECNEQLYFADGTPDKRYPGFTPKEKRAEVIKFWKAFPRAWVRFYWGCFYDWIKFHYRQFRDRGM